MTDRPARFLLLVALAITHLVIAPPAAAVRLQEQSPAPTVLELQFSLTNRLSSGLSPQTIWAVRLHLEAGTTRGPVALTLVLDPAVWGDGGTQTIAGITEAYLRWPTGTVTWSAGVERLPLEVGRLTLPFSVEPVDALGLRAGRLGVRAVWYPDDATRVRLGAFDFDGAVVPLLSVRRQFSGFELEAHTLSWSGRTALGLGGSGLAGSLVVYGEVWTLTAPTEWRYALGASGSVRNGIWTLEAGDTSARPGAARRRQVAAQIAGRAGPDLSWSLTGRGFFDADAVRTQASLELVRTWGRYEFTLTVGGEFGPQPPAGLIGAVLRISL